MIISNEMQNRLRRNNGVVLIAGRPGIGRRAYMVELINEIENGKLYEIAIILLNHIDYYGSTTYGVLESDERGNLCIATDEILHSESEWQRIIKKYPLMNTIYDDSITYGKFHFEKIVEFLSTKKHIKYIFIDDLHRMHFDSLEEANLSMHLRFLIYLSKKYSVSIVTYCSAHRRLEERENKRPGICDLDIDYDLLSQLDGVILLYRDSYYFKDASLLDPDTLSLEVQEVLPNSVTVKTINYKNYPSSDD